MNLLTDGFRDPKKARRIASKIKGTSKELEQIKLMNVCGTHEMTIVQQGIREMIPENIQLVAGPGCPVCVTPAGEIDEAIKLADEEGIVTTFGDMYRVPGSFSSLADAKMEGADVRIVYGISDAVKIARENPEDEVIHVAIGFETTAPTTAAEMLDDPPENFSVLVCHRIMPPIMEYLLQSGETEIDGYICPGHVSTIIGVEPYIPLSEKFGVSQVISGFEPLDVLLSILMLLQQIGDGRGEVENEYGRFVRHKGNKEAKRQMAEVFKAESDIWRGFPNIPNSKLNLRREFGTHDARQRFDIEIEEGREFFEGCRCGDVLKGLISPPECPLFLEKCLPESPKGPCMVSVEGTCNVWAKHGDPNRL